MHCSDMTLYEPWAADAEFATSWHEKKLEMALGSMLTFKSAPEAPGERTILET